METVEFTIRDLWTGESNILRSANGLTSSTRSIVMPWTLGIFLSLLLLCSCATTPEPSAFIPASELPADVTMNKEAGRGNWLFVTLRLESGEELPFFVDTGATLTLLDQSLEPKLGKRLGTGRVIHFDSTSEAGIYAAPRIYLGSTPLMTGSNIMARDLKQPSSLSGRPIMGVLGMDCLRHYCIQLDFEAGNMRFLDPEHVDAAQLGKAFPLTFRWGCPFIHHSSLIGGEVANLSIDTGYNKDGALNSKLFRREVQERTLRLEGDTVDGKKPSSAWLPECVWNGETYTNLIVGSQDLNVLGLRFLARHLVTFDFPKRTIYLKQKSVGPLVDENMEAAAEFLKNLKEEGQMPGWSKNDNGAIDLEAHPNSETYGFRKNGDSSTFHYRVTRTSIASPWRLQKAWRTDQNDHMIEEYRVP